jgi:hypothetical protein
MIAAWASAGVLLLGCSPPPAPPPPAVEATPAPAAAPRPPPRHLSDCEAYTDPEAASYCRLLLTSRRPLVMGTALAICGDAGVWVEDCRMEWVAHRLSSDKFTREELLAGCAGDPDCNFRVLDDRIEGDVLDQIADCKVLAGRYASDCTRHALSRWRRASPDGAEMQRVMDGAPSKTLVGLYIGLVVACEQVGACLGPPAAIRECEASIRDVENRPAVCDAVR